MKLRPTLEQKRIVKFNSGTAMVRAGAGCTKTTTLAMRAGHLIETGVKPRSIVILTYSKALTLDIKKTLAKLLGDEVADKVVVMTIHAFAYRLIRRHNKQQGLARPSVLTQKQQKQLMKSYAKKTKLKLSEIKRAFYHYETGYPTKAETALGTEKAAQAERAYKAYCSDKKKRNKFDFGGMIGQALELLEHDGGSSLLGSYAHLMIDELQDIDFQQKRLIVELSKYMNSTVIVGDPLQSIYGWRHALPRYWKDITDALGPKQFALTESFRIPQQALPFVNFLARKLDKDAPTLRSSVDGCAPVLVDLADQDAQYQWLVKKLKSLVAKIDPRKIVILAKTRRELSMTVVALRARNIHVTERYYPAHINQHRTHLLALLRLTRLEKQRLTRSSKQLTKAELAEARDYMENLWFDKTLIATMQDRLTIKPKSIIRVPPDNKRYGRINDISNALSRAVSLSNIESAIQCLIDATKPVLKDQDDNHHKLLLRDLIDIKIKVRGCATLDDIDDKWFDAPEGGNDGISITTVHSAKGQEWDYVFLINVVDGVYPHYGTKTKSLVDELRVFYVAVTRHHKQLYLLQAPLPIKLLGKNSKDKHGSAKRTEFTEPSPFIDVENQCLIYLDTKKRGSK